MNLEPVYLDSYVLQQDMRIRLPKQILENLPAEKWKTIFRILFDSSCSGIILRMKKTPSNKTCNKNEETR